MKVILLQDVKGTDKKGELVDVSDGFARNFLLPKKAAKKATAAVQAEVKETKKAPAKKATTAKAAKKEEVTVEFAGKAYTTEQLVQIAKDVWKYDLGRKATEFKTVKIYVKPEENQAYYVVNDEVTGSFSL